MTRTKDRPPAPAEFPANEAEAAAQEPPPATPTPRNAVVLPTKRSKPTGLLQDKTVVIYGPPKIGKSTLVAESGPVLFADCEAGLGDLEVFRMTVTTWMDFLMLCSAYAQDPKKYTGFCIDTADMLALFCSTYIKDKLGILHESDAEWGKGWTLVREEFVRPLAKLAAIPDRGLFIVSHAKEVEIKTRSRKYNRSVPTLTGQLRDVVLNMADVILFVDFDGEGEDEHRVIRTKPSAYWEAGERGAQPRLPETIRYEAGQGWAAVNSAWNGGTK